MTRISVLTLLGALLAHALVDRAVVADNVGETRTIRSVMVEAVNERPAFMVRVDVDHPNRIYRDGEVMRVYVTSEKAGYLYLLYCAADDTTTCLFPNQLQKDNRIKAHDRIVVPTSDAPFRLRIAGPLGNEVLKAFVTLRPLSKKGLDALIAHGKPSLSLEGVKAVIVEARERSSANWAEHHVCIKTVPEGTRTVAKRRRVGLFVGVREYEDDKIDPLAVCHRDARSMCAVMGRLGRLDETILLVDQQATLANIRNAMCERLPALTRPGDTVIIYWSGHGGRCADDNGDEPDEYDEYLVPYDGRWGRLDTIRKTMLLDDLFFRWIQGMDGRKVVLILDTCHSGGQAKGIGSGKGLRQPEQPAGSQFDFLDGELYRTKDIGQRETAMLASAHATQKAFERPDGDLSVMTHFLIELLESNGSSVTLPQAAAHVKREVPAYVKKRFPGATQTPVLLDNTTPPVYLKP